MIPAYKTGTIRSSVSCHSKNSRSDWGITTARRLAKKRLRRLIHSPFASRTPGRCCLACRFLWLSPTDRAGRLMLDGGPPCRALRVRCRCHPSAHEGGVRRLSPPCPDTAPPASRAGDDTSSTRSQSGVTHTSAATARYLRPHRQMRQSAHATLSVTASQAHDGAEPPQIKPKDSSGRSAARFATSSFIAAYEVPRSRRPKQSIDDKYRCRSRPRN